MVCSLCTCVPSTIEWCSVLQKCGVSFYWSLIRLGIPSIPNCSTFDVLSETSPPPGRLSVYKKPQIGES